MEKYNSIKDYLDSEEMTVDDLKDMILRTSLDFGCNVAHVDEDVLKDTENLFYTLSKFNDLLDSVV